MLKKHFSSVRGTKFIIKAASWTVLLESIFAFVFYHTYDPMSLCQSLALICGINSAHENIENYIVRRNNAQYHSDITD